MRKAMIFAAGLGTRLGDITKYMPKVMVKIGGKSVLQYIVEKCTLSGFEDIIVNVHHHSAMLIDEIESLKRKGYTITVSDETDKLLDTGGGLFKARHFFGDEPFLVYNGDIVTDLDLDSLYAYHLDKGGMATLAVRERNDSRCLLVDEHDMLRGWRNRVTGEKILKCTPDTVLKEICFSGIGVIDSDIFAYMKEGVYGLMPVYLELSATNRINTFLHNSGYWLDIGTPEKLHEAQVKFESVHKERFS